MIPFTQMRIFHSKDRPRRVPGQSLPKRGYKKCVEILTSSLHGQLQACKFSSKYRGCWVLARKAVSYRLRVGLHHAHLGKPRVHCAVPVSPSSEETRNKVNGSLDNGGQQPRTHSRRFARRPALSCGADGVARQDEMIERPCYPATLLVAVHIRRLQLSPKVPRIFHLQVLNYELCDTRGISCLHCQNRNG